MDRYLFIFKSKYLLNVSNFEAQVQSYFKSIRFVEQEYDDIEKSITLRGDLNTRTYETRTYEEMNYLEEA